VTRLSNATHPGRTMRGVGIVHLGLGAFTRAHQAWYTDRAMATAGGDWMIAGVSLRSPAVAAQLNPQDGLYTLAAGDGLAVIGSIAEVVVAPEDPARVIDLIAAPATRIVTFTVTEKGYCRGADGGLDRALAAQGFYPLLAEALARRMAAGRAGLTLLSCDNLADNGGQLRRLLLEWLDPALGAWVAAHCTFPCSMVDRIVPATTAADRDAIEARLGLRDEGAVITEPFSQWVIEDAFAGERPAWDRVGAQVVAEVAPYETAKLRMLNGAHSALAYCGLRLGYAHVHEAIRDAVLRGLVLRLMLQEAAPTIAATPDQDLGAYAQALVTRFENPALGHRLIQIAMDGSQKIPQRWLATLAANQRAGRRCPAILAAIGAWCAHLRGDNAGVWGPVDDPRAEALRAVWRDHDVATIGLALFGPDGPMHSDWRPDADDGRAIAQAIGAQVPA
jgi:fructuronate reductase